VDHNIMEGSWRLDQNGILVAFSIVNQDGGCTWCVIRDATFTNNIVRKGNVGLATNREADALAGSNIIVSNNLFYEINELYGQGVQPTGRLFQILGDGWSNLTFEHNTGDLVNTTSSSVVFAGGADAFSAFTFRANLTEFGYYGVFGDSGGGGTGALDYHLTTYTFTNNVMFIDRSVSPYTPPAVPVYPAGNAFPALSGMAAQFTNTATGNYRLVAGSVYKAGGAFDAFDDTDMGVNMCNGAFPDPAGDGNQTLNCRPVLPTIH
jgi:hypothetical protein